MLRKAIGSAAVLAGMVVGAYSYGQHISRVDTWELDFTSKPPRVLEILEDSKEVAYTYIIYEVTNGTAEEIDFHPTFEIEDEEGKLFRAGAYPLVYKRLAKRLGEKLLPFSKIAGIIKPGEKKMGVALFKGANVASDKLTVYVAGLSGDVKADKTETGEIVAKYKTYKLVYKRPGDEFSASIDPVKLKSTTWVWR